MVKNVGIILAGGIGSRFKGNKPKQYYMLNGKEVIAYSMDAFKKATTIDEIVVVLDENEYNNRRIEKEYNVKTILGGKTRNESFNNALKYIKENYKDCERIIENNAACPMITSELIDKYINLLNDYDCVSTAYSITDALARYDKEPVNRDDFYLIQAPDAYRVDLLYKYFDESSNIIHPAQQLPKERKEYLYFDYNNNIKITYQQDLKKASELLNNLRTHSESSTQNIS